MQPLTRGAILAADDIKRELVEVPSWGGAVYVQTLTGSGRDAFEAACQEEGPDGQRVGLHNYRGRLLVHAIVDEGGNRLFKDEDADVLGRKSTAALRRLYDVAARLSGFTTEPAAEPAPAAAA